MVTGGGALAWVRNIFTTTIGSKIIVAITAICLTGFVVIHLIGNLKLLSGPEAINSYAKFLQDLGPLLWVARGTLLVMFILHVVLVIRLKSKSAAARPVPYAYPVTIQASAASRFMLMTGLVILVFLLFHLAHFTFGWIKPAVIDGEEVNYLALHDAKGRHDVYTMVVQGFKNPYISIFYLFAQAVLFWHLSHGISSVFQTLGLNAPRFQPVIKTVCWLLAFSILVGNCTIVLAVWTGQVS